MLTWPDASGPACPTGDDGGMFGFGRPSTLPDAADALPGRDVAGKTGTAQVISNQGREATRGRGERKRIRVNRPEVDRSTSSPTRRRVSPGDLRGRPLAIRTYVRRQAGRNLHMLVTPGQGLEP